jgi:hypothetical protein
MRLYMLIACTAWEVTVLMWAWALGLVWLQPHHQLPKRNVEDVVDRGIFHGRKRRK